MTATPAGLPMPRARRPVGHLGRWGTDPLRLLEEGATLGPVFGLRLWRPAVVGYSPEWNRLLMRDLDTFRSAGSLSGLTPYLAGSVVAADGEAHTSQRNAISPAFGHDVVGALEPALSAEVRAHLPTGEFDALTWSTAVVRRLLAVAFFGGRFPPALLARFLHPLDQPMPAPFLRRPLLFRRMDRALAAALEAAPDHTIAAALRGVDAAVEHLRVTISAGYDTTAHTMAWLLWHLADVREPADVDRRQLVNETLRMYPAGWVGSRVCARDVEFGGHRIPAGTLVLYSPYLSHRDPASWPAPLEFRPGRFSEPARPWTFIPFAAGKRRCLGMHLARLILETTVGELVAAGRPLRRVAGDPAARAGVTLMPRGPLTLRR
jgi:cytochrome P450